MSIEDVDVIDKIGIDKETQEVVLVISDHLSWEDLDFHKRALVKKINSYMEYIFSGTMLASNPEFSNKYIRIKLVCKFKPSANGWETLSEMSNILKYYNLYFSHSVLEA